MARVYQTTSSLQSTTASLNQFTASQDSRNFVVSQVTGSLIGITNGLMAYTSSNETWKTGVRGEISAIEAWTASLDSTYATDAQLYQLYAETASIKAEIAGIEALTASMKASTIVSSSTQIQNYNKFALTASANTFYGTQTFSGSINVTSSITIDNVLIIAPRTTTPTIGTVPTGSIIVSASVGRVKPWIWDGWDWNPFY